MNKILLSGLAGLAVINAANAGIRETCLQNPDKLVWVEKTERCVPINTCKASDQTIVDSYCNRDFADVQVENYDQADKLAHKYIEVRMGKSVTSGGVIETTYMGNDYYGYKLSDGGYEVFEFDDTSDRTKGTVQFGIWWGVCGIIYHKNNMFAMAYLGVDGAILADGYATCYATETMDAPESDCKEMADVISEISGFSVNYNFETDVKGTGKVCSIEFI